MHIGKLMGHWCQLIMLSPKILILANNCCFHEGYFCGMYDSNKKSLMKFKFIFLADSKN
jgi:hypothetical protein